MAYIPTTAEVIQAVNGKMGRAHQQQQRHEWVSAGVEGIIQSAPSWSKAGFDCYLRLEGGSAIGMYPGAQLDCHQALKYIMCSSILVSGRRHVGFGPHWSKPHFPAHWFDAIGVLRSPPYLWERNKHMGITVSR